MSETPVSKIAETVYHNIETNVKISEQKESKFLKMYSHSFLLKVLADIFYQ